MIRKHTEFCNNFLRDLESRTGFILKLLQMSIVNLVIISAAKDFSRETQACGFEILSVQNQSKWTLI